MEGVVTILGEPHYSLVESLWHQVNEICHLEGVKPTDIPHFSWHVAETYAEGRLAGILREICAETEPFTVQTAGLGMFTAEKCVLYITLVKDAPLFAFHQKLWERLQGVGERPSPYYSPEQWVPHITLAYQNLGGAELSCAVGELACKPFVWQVQVDNLAAIGEEGLQSGKGLLRFPFGGGEKISR
jgi:hypothetical protein